MKREKKTFLLPGEEENIDPKTNYSLYYLMKEKGPLSNMPGIDKSEVIRTVPCVIREDGYKLPTWPMTKFQWKLRYFLAFFCEWIGRDE